MKISLGEGKYLGLSYLIGQSKKEIFRYLKERIWKKTHGWIEKHLSRGGKEFLIKSILRQFHVLLCHYLRSHYLSVRKFWWGTQGDGKVCLGYLGIPCVKKNPLVE